MTRTTHLTHTIYRERTSDGRMQKRHICLHSAGSRSRTREIVEAVILAVLLFLSCCAWGVV